MSARSPQAGPDAGALRAENERLRRRVAELEQHSHDLANLYVASSQLHASLDVTQVVRATVEIVVNLIGAEEFAIYVLDEGGGRLEPVAGEGRPRQAFPAYALEADGVGKAVARGEVVCAGAEPVTPERPLACIPLRVRERPVGAIVIHRLLPHKPGLTPLDHELFGVLAGHAAAALCAARLHAESERKLGTVRGFIDLLTS